jgi:CarD family transcriptional regulator
LDTYSVGSKVVHPAHGAGTIVAIQEKSLGDLRRTYYVINTLSTGVTAGTRQLMVPVSRAIPSGLRRVGKAAGLREVLRNCTPPEECDIDKDYRTRQEAIRTLLNSGSFAQVVDAVLTLYVLHLKRPLGVVDRQLLDHGKDILASELAVATNTEMEDALRELETTLAAVVGEDEE